jgi:hypothetical protein
MSLEQLTASEPAASDEAPWFLHRRVEQPQDQFLVGDTVRLLFGMPRGIRPIQLQEQFPRIANELPMRWHNAHGIHAYLSELLEDRRGNRRGFPPLVVEELQALRRFIERRTHAEAAALATGVSPGQAKRRRGQDAL